MLSEYRAKWFDGLEWRWREWDFIAESPEQVREAVDKLCAPEFRHRQRTTVESLEITVICPEVTMPFPTHTDL